MSLGNVEVKDNCMFVVNVFISLSNHDYFDPQSNDYLSKEIGKKSMALRVKSTIKFNVS